MTSTRSLETFREVNAEARDKEKHAYGERAIWQAVPCSGNQLPGAVSFTCEAIGWHSRTMARDHNCRGNEAKAIEPANEVGRGRDAGGHEIA